MNKEEIKKILIERGYSVPGAETASEDLRKISDCLKPALDSWLKSNIETDFEVDGFSIKGIMQRFRMKYPAALLSLNWILKDPKTAITAIKRGLR